mmetsp:Transcript_11820/g.28210  ORF Transcript_11820/g.28210 Transcript_11820/m.28210 type:complete len:449 (-) Transcript_11820:310-1656(-)
MLLDAVRDRRDGRDGLLLHDPHAPHQQLHQLPQQHVQVGHEDVLVAVLCEVDDGRSSMRLHARVRGVLHHVRQRRQHARMELVLEVRAQVRLQLAHRVDRCPSDPGVLVLEAPGDLLDHRLQHLLHLLRAPLCDLRDARQRRVPVLPVGVVQEGGNEVLAEGEGKDGLAAQGEGQAVEAVLAHVQRGELRVVVIVVRRAVPLRHVHLGDDEHELEGEGDDVLEEGGLLAHHRRRLLRQRHQQLHCQEPCLVLQVRRRHDLDRHLRHRVQVLPEELRRLLRNRNEFLDGRARGLLVLHVERVCEDRHHQGDHVGEGRDVLVEARERLHQAACRVQRRQLDFLLRILQHLRAQLFQLGDAPNHLRARNKGKAGENEHGAFSERGSWALGRLRDEGHDLGPVAILHDHRCYLSSGIRDVAAHNIDCLVRHGLQQGLLDSCLRTGGELFEEL